MTPLPPFSSSTSSMTISSFSLAALPPCPASSPTAAKMPICSSLYAVWFPTLVIWMHTVTPSSDLVTLSIVSGCSRPSGSSVSSTRFPPGSLTEPNALVMVRSRPAANSVSRPTPSSVTVVLDHLVLFCSAMICLLDFRYVVLMMCADSRHPY